MKIEANIFKKLRGVKLHSQTRKVVLEVFNFMTKEAREVIKII